MTIDPKMFRAYDIRGTYPDQVNGQTANLIGKAFGSYLQIRLKLTNPKVAVGKDARSHSAEIHKGFVEGLMSTGCQVTNAGLCASPYLYFAVTHGRFDAGCNITASHNPKEYNGFKLVTKEAHAVFGDELQELLMMIENEEFVYGEGNLSVADHRPDYEATLRTLFPEFKRKLKVVVDTGNGVAGAMYPQIIEKLGHEVIGLYTELDGNFPNHEPDPIVEANLEDLKKKVIETGADLGLAFDGDGDRVGMVTEQGEFINADKLLMLLAQDVLSRHPGKAVVFTVSNSQSLFELVEKWGGKPVMCKVGHSYVEHAMTQHNAILGGEQSGHFFMPEGYYSYDDALVTACRILKIASDEARPISQHLHEFPQTFSEPEMRPYCADEVKFQVLKKIQEYFKDKYPNSMLDGIRLDFGHGGWSGIRVSNTSPCLSITMEAQTKEHLEEIKKVVLNHLNTYAEIEWKK